MGILEKESKKKTQRANLKKIILGTVAVAGILSVAAVAPNVLGAMAKIGILPHGRQKESIHRARERLIRQGLLVYQNGLLHLTSKGEAVLRRMEMYDFAINKPNSWDKKWRVLIFDIPEQKKVLRNKIRLTLSTIGFVRLQQSVWLYPYDCEDFIVLLKTEFHIGKDLLYLIVDTLEYDAPFRKQFNLPM